MTEVFSDYTNRRETRGKERVKKKMSVVIWSETVQARP